MANISSLPKELVLVFGGAMDTNVALLVFVIIKVPFLIRCYLCCTRELQNIRLYGPKNS